MAYTFKNKTSLNMSASQLLLAYVGSCVTDLNVELWSSGPDHELPQGRGHHYSPLFILRVAQNHMLNEMKIIANM